MKERLLEFIRFKGMRVSTFEKMAGLSNAYVQNFKGNMSAEKLERVLNAFPELNQTWLLTGEGEMIKRNEDDAPRYSVSDNSDIDLRTKLAMREQECRLMQSNIDALREIIQAQKMIIQSLSDQIEILKQH